MPEHSCPIPAPEKAEVLQEAEYSEESFDLRLTACSFVSELGL